MSTDNCQETTASFIKNHYVYSIFHLQMCNEENKSSRASQLPTQRVKSPQVGSGERGGGGLLCEYFGQGCTPGFPNPEPFSGPKSIIFYSRFETCRSGISDHNSHFITWRDVSRILCALSQFPVKTTPRWNQSALKNRHTLWGSTRLSSSNERREYPLKN